MSEIKVEVGQYKAIEKGALKASFSIVVYPMGQKILDCKLFASGTKRWFNMPSKEIKKEGEKSNFIPYISYLDKAYEERFKIAVLAELKKLEESQPPPKAERSMFEESPF